MRIISLVPSWTETLIEAGVPLVGRTRYCVHPRNVVSMIPVVGGTKTADWDKIRALKPDLLILDQEENPITFSKQGLPFWASHVKDGKSLAKAFGELGELFKNVKLQSFQNRMENILNHPNLSAPSGKFPGCLEILRPWHGDEVFTYVIWKNPWMTVHPQTYIGFVLQKIGIPIRVWGTASQMYPEFEMDIKPHNVYLFSSEPYPFEKQKEELLALNVKGALVDGEKFSWFGIRSLEFLEEALQPPKL